MKSVSIKIIAVAFSVVMAATLTAFAQGVHYDDPGGFPGGPITQALDCPSGDADCVVGNAGSGAVLNMAKATDIVEFHNAADTASIEIDLDTSDRTDVRAANKLLAFTAANVSISTSVGGSTTLSLVGSLSMSGTGQLTSAASADIGWSLQSAANQACNATCTSACVFGWDTASGEVAVGCSDATADKCLCAGGS